MIDFWIRGSFPVNSILMTSGLMISGPITFSIISEARNVP